MRSFDRFSSKCSLSEIVGDPENWRTDKKEDVNKFGLLNPPAAETKLGEEQ